MHAATFSIEETGFSFVELLASIAIVGLLASIAMPLAETTARRQKENDLRLALREIRQAIDAYKAASLGGKVFTRPDQSGYPPSLLELASGVDDISNPGQRLYFLRRIPRDPFLADPAVAPVDTWGLRSFDSPPDAPRSGSDVFDVYSTSKATGMNGVPYAGW